MKKEYENCELSIYSSSYMPLDERMYLVLSGGQAMLVDPNCDLHAVGLLIENGIRELKIVLTHCHYDHITGIQFFQERFACEVIATALCIENINNPRKNLSKYAGLVFASHGWSNEDVPDIQPFSCNGNTGFDGEYYFSLGGVPIRLKAFPGHSPDGLFIFIGDIIVFTGDNLIPDTPVSLSLPGSDIKAYEAITKPFIMALPPETLICPGHCDVDTLGQALRTHPDFC